MHCSVERALSSPGRVQTTPQGAGWEGTGIALGACESGLVSFLCGLPLRLLDPPSVSPWLSRGPRSFLPREGFSTGMSPARPTRSSSGSLLKREQAAGRVAWPAVSW